METGDLPSPRRAARELSHAAAFAVGPLAVDPSSRRVSADEHSEMLEPKVMRVLVAFGEAGGKVLSRDDLIEQCWDGVVVGDNAINQVISRLRRVFADLTGGAVRLETITKVGFRLVCDAAEAGTASATADSGMAIVAVLPFTNRDGGEDLDSLAEDLTEEITRELASSSYFKVIAASTMASWRGKAIDNHALGLQTGARYFIEGKLQRAGEDLRLTVQLIDAESESMVWSPRFSRKSGDIPEASGAFPVHVASQLREHIFQIDANRVMAKQGALSGWDHILRAEAYRARWGTISMHKCIEELRHAVCVAPELGIAHAMLASNLGALASTQNSLGDSQIREIGDHITRALQLDGDNPAVLSDLAHAYVFLQDLEAGLRLAQRAWELAPNSGLAQNALGMAYLMLGRTSDAIDTLSKDGRFASEDKIHRLGRLGMLGMCLCLEGRPAEAEAALDQVLAHHPNFSLALRWKAVAAVQQGLDQAGRDAVKLLREAEPGMSDEQFLGAMTRVPVDNELKHQAVAILRRLLEETEGKT